MYIEACLSKIWKHSCLTSSVNIWYFFYPLIDIKKKYEVIWPNAHKFHFRSRQKTKQRHIESNTGKSARQGNLRHPRVRFQSFADEVRHPWNLTRGYRRFPCLALFAGVWFYFSLLSVVVYCLTAMYFQQTIM